MKTLLLMLLLYIQPPVVADHPFTENDTAPYQGFFWEAVNDYVKKRATKEGMTVVKKIESPGCKDALLKANVEKENGYFIDIFIKPRKRSRRIEVLNGGEKVYVRGKILDHAFPDDYGIEVFQSQQINFSNYPGTCQIKVEVNEEASIDRYACFGVIIVLYEKVQG